MNDVQLAAASAGKGLANTATAIGTAQNGLNTFTSNANTALENGSGLISQAASDTTTSINKVTTAVSSASGTAQQAVSNMQSVTDSNAQLIERLKNVSDNAQYQDIIKKLEHQQHGRWNAQRPQNVEREHTIHVRQRVPNSPPTSTPARKIR